MYKITKRVVDFGLFFYGILNKKEKIKIKEIKNLSLLSIENEIKNLFPNESLSFAESESDIVTMPRIEHNNYVWLVSFNDVIDLMDEIDIVCELGYNVVILNNLHVLVWSDSKKLPIHCKNIKQVIPY